MSKTRPTECLAPDRLRRYLAEELDESDEAHIEDHLGACAACQRALERVAGAPSDWSRVRDELQGRDAQVALPIEAPATRGPADDLREVAELCDPTDDPEKVGRIGGYEVCGLVGRGTTGIVLKAFEPRLHRFVAIKLLSPIYRNHGSARLRFEREARAIAAVSHEHVVPIHAVDEHHGLPFLVMKYVAGRSLEERLQHDGPLDTCAAARIGLQVAEALAAAHAQGVVHRDVKPGNVLLEGSIERALVTDFGLARVADEASMTQSGTISGTPHYMSPEQARGESTDPRSDLFSLGSLLYATCTGRPPFRAENVFGVLQRVAQARPRPVRELQPGIQPWLAALVERLMAKRPEERFQGAAEVAGILRAELAHLQNPAGAAEPPRAWLLRAPAPAGGERRTGRARRLKLAAVAFGTVGAGFLALDRTDAGRALQASVMPRLAGLFGRAAQDGGASDASAPDSGVWRHTQLESARGVVTAFEQELTRVVPIETARLLVARVDDGDVELAPGAEGHVRVRVRRTVVAPDQDAAAARLEREPLRVTVEQERCVLEADGRVDGALEGDLPRSTIVLELPAGLRAEVATRGGSIAAEGVDGALSLKTEGGSVHVGRLGGALDVRAEGGDVVARGALLGAVDIFAVRGAVELAGAQAGARVRTSGGAIVLGRSAGEVTAQAAGGDIRVDGMLGRTAVHSEGGDVLVQLPSSPLAPGYFSSAGGDVRVELARDIAATVSAQGALTSTLAFTPGTSESGAPCELFELGGGGELLRVVSSSGRIEVLEVEPAPVGEGEPNKSAEMGRKLDLGGSDLGGSDLGGSDLGGSGLGGSGLGGSDPRGADLVELSDTARSKLTDAPRAGALATVVLPEPLGNVDGYTLYLPLSHDTHEGTFPVIVYLQGSYGVGGEVGDLNHWGLPRLLRDELDPTTRRNRLLLDGFVVLSPHIADGQYHDHPEAIAALLDHVLATTKADPTRVSMTGLSRGGHGTWGLAAALPGRFAAIAPVAGDPDDFDAPLATLCGTSVWIAHNRTDPLAPFQPVEEAARRIEDTCGVTFLRTTPSEVGATDWLDRTHVQSSAVSGGHDAWTDLYSNPEFYEWLVRQHRPARSAPATEDPSTALPD